MVLGQADRQNIYPALDVAEQEKLRLGLYPKKRQ